MSLTPEKFQELLDKAKKLAAQRRALDEQAGLDKIEEDFTSRKPATVDLRNIGIDTFSLHTVEGRNDAVEILSEVASGSSGSIGNSKNPTVDELYAEISKRNLINFKPFPERTVTVSKKIHTTGVAADVSLNARQQLFIDTALSGEDVCLIGAAGTGKTTVTGKFISRLIDSGKLKPLGHETKWLNASVPGVLITSFTRKAVNNIRRAVPPLLQPHVLTMHKVLEFQPVFYEAFDEKTGVMKNTMKFEPQRHALNPLPSNLKLVCYEESSMIGTDLYNMMSAAMPHNPQEVFIGDIRQLPPIFGPAILGFKMSLLTVIELNEVYRQALLSPIIRLAHAVLSGDSSLFDTAGKYTEREPHAHLIDAKTGKPEIVERIHIPKLEKFNEEGEHGSVKIQIWQKKLPSEVACNTSALQFIAWEKQGYYKPDDDLILCPFNVSFGTVELNKKIQNYLGVKRGAVVHEVISGFEKHYLAIGDRILYDKEDAVIVDIKRNVNYMGKAVSPPSKFLDRWGAYQEQLSEEEVEKAKNEEQVLSVEAMDNFISGFSDDDEDRVNVASHAIDIRFSYSDETTTLSTAGEINSILGGNAITVHKMQGSENSTIFLVLHHSHAAMLQNELLYTGISRARDKLHIICEIDTFFKGVKSHKVRGVTLADKIDFFKGNWKSKFKEMEAEMEMLVKQKEVKKKRLEIENEREFQVVENEIVDEYYPEPEEQQIKELEDAYRNIDNRSDIHSGAVDKVDDENIWEVTVEAPKQLILSAAEKLAAMRTRLGMKS